MTTPHEARPQWVLVDEKLRIVSDFSNLLPGQRPPALCPLCRTQVIFKLGSVRVHHYAHSPDIICAATQPETALHLNAKYNLNSKLLQTQSIAIINNCVNNCGGFARTIWLRDWDEVRVEHTLSSFRPDITLLSKGQTIGAIEILVSHLVTKEKEAFFTENNIPCLEVKASEVYDGLGFKWTPEKPLPFYRQFPSPEPWICEDCLRIMEIQKLASSVQKSGQPKPLIFGKTTPFVQTPNPVSKDVIVETKLVDIYWPSGKKYREMYYLKKQIVNGKCLQVKLEADKKGLLMCIPFNDQACENIHAFVQKKLDNYERQDARLDVQVDWQPWVDGKRYVAKDTNRHPFRYWWDQEQLSWVKVNPPISAQLQPDIDYLASAKRSGPVFYSYSNKSYSCEKCGKLTSDWIVSYQAKNTCICRECMYKKE